MKLILSIACAVFLLFSGLYAQSQNCLTKNQILLTSEGIYCEIDGCLQSVDSISYFDGQYVAIRKPFIAGQCDQCGSHVGPNGRCENPYCNNSGRHGPRERD